MTPTILTVQRTEPDEELHTAEAALVAVYAYTGAVLMVLDDGTRLAFDREQLRLTLEVGKA